MCRGEIARRWLLALSELTDTFRSLCRSVLVWIKPGSALEGYLFTVERNRSRYLAVARVRLLLGRQGHIADG